MELAQAFKAVENINFGSAVVPAIPPEDTWKIPITLLARFNNRILNCSNNSILSQSQLLMRMSYASFDVVT